MSRLSSLLLLVLLSVRSLAQMVGVCPAGASDAVTAQLAGNVETVREETWTVDYSRHVVEKNERTSVCETVYDNHGNILSVETIDKDGEQNSKTIYQYTADGQKRVSTTYSARGERTLQTLYAYTADGYLARLRFTDALAVTISTTECSITPTFTETQEVYKDGQTVRTAVTYDNAFHPTKITRTDGTNKRQLLYKLDRAGRPTKATYTRDDGTTVNLSYTYTLDTHGNWTERITYSGETPTEIATREISYR